MPHDPTDAPTWRPAPARQRPSNADTHRTGHEAVPPGVDAGTAQRLDRAVGTLARAVALLRARGYPVTLGAGLGVAQVLEHPPPRVQRLDDPTRGERVVLAGVNGVDMLLELARRGLDAVDEALGVIDQRIRDRQADRARR